MGLSVTTISAPPPPSTPQPQWACGSPYLYTPIDPLWGEVVNIIPATFTTLLLPGTQLRLGLLGTTDPPGTTGQHDTTDPPGTTDPLDFLQHHPSVKLNP